MKKIFLYMAAVTVTNCLANDHLNVVLANNLTIRGDLLGFLSRLYGNDLGIAKYICVEGYASDSDLGDNEQVNSNATITLFLETENCVTVPRDKTLKLKNLCLEINHPAALGKDIILEDCIILLNKNKQLCINGPLNTLHECQIMGDSDTDHPLTITFTTNSEIIITGTLEICSNFLVLENVHSDNCLGYLLLSFFMKNHIVLQPNAGLVLNVPDEHICMKNEPCWKLLYRWCKAKIRK